MIGQHDVTGPIDYLVVEFPGNQFNGEVAPAIIDLIAAGTVRVLDLAFVAKDAAGDVAALEFEDLPVEHVGPLAGIEQFLVDLVTEEDIAAVAADLAPNSSALMIIWENAWAAPFVAAVQGSGGEVVASGRIPAAQILAALEH